MRSQKVYSLNKHREQTTSEKKKAIWNFSKILFQITDLSKKSHKENQKTKLSENKNAIHQNLRDTGKERRRNLQHTEMHRQCIRSQVIIQALTLRNQKKNSKHKVK